jgi:hypothetical protein
LKGRKQGGWLREKELEEESLSDLEIEERVKW